MTYRYTAEEIGELNARIDQLEAALKPFAESAERYAKCRDDRPLVHTWNAGETLAVGDLRRARDLLAS